MQEAKRSKSLIGTALLSTAYLPPIEYFAALANSERALVERCETFQKQSYRTRCHIYSANGLLALTIPVKRDCSVLQMDGAHSEGKDLRPTHKLLIDSIQIDYGKPWLQQHKRAIEAAYMTTPFFEYYKDDLFAVMDSGEESLFNLNFKLIELFNELIGISTPVSFTDEWRGDYGVEVEDFRDRIHPKSKEENLLCRMQIEKPYYQTFSNKQGFIPNLSILDLLCNEGPNSITFLKAETYR